MKALWFLILTVVLFAGCTTHRGVQPDSPGSGVVDYWVVPRVDSLQPILKWKPIEGIENVTYDLIVYEAIKEVWPGWRSEMATGPEVYYREGIEGTIHRIEVVLRGNTQYFWAVRARKNGKVSAWSASSYNDFVEKRTNYLFSFKTPKTSP